MSDWPVPTFAPYIPPDDYCPSCPFPEIADPRAAVKFCADHAVDLAGADDDRVGEHTYFQIADADGATCRAVQSLIR